MDTARSRKLNGLRTAEEILAYFQTWSLGEESLSYLRYHRLRYEFLLKKLDELVARIQGELRDRQLRILDVGPGFQTELLRKTTPGAAVSTLGFRDDRFEPRRQDRHFEFDLNDSQYPDRWPEIELHDLVVMAEVIEHLYTYPGLVLQCASTWMGDGAYLVIQTPNACALHKRLKALIGQNPYDMIRETRLNPGHFREYTIKELLSIADQSGFDLVDLSTRNYFDSGTASHRLYNALAPILPRSLRQGVTLILMKPVQQRDASEGNRPPRVQGSRGMGNGSDSCVQSQ